MITIDTSARRQKPAGILQRFPALLFSVLLVGAASKLPAAPVPEAFQPLRLGEVKPEGWLKAQLQRDLDSGFQGHLDALLQQGQGGEYVLAETNNDYVTRANNKKSRHNAQGLTIPAAPQAWWNAEMIADYYDGLIRAAFLVGDEKATQKADRFIADILKSQDEDGYLGIYPRGYRFHFASADGELWTQRCAFLALLSYYEFTGRADVLQAVERAVKLTLSQYGPEDNYFDNPRQPNSGVSHGLLFVDVLEWLYRLTSNDQYRSAAVYFYDSYSASKVVANKEAQLSRLLDQQRALGGHGPDIMGFLRVPLLSYYLTGKPEYRQAWENSLLKLDRHLGVGGSPLSGSHEEIQREGQTPDLPYEYCSTFYLLHTLAWAMQKTGEPRFSDMLETTLFNAAQGARFSNGKALTYYSADERLWVRQHPPEGAGNRRYIYTAAFYPSCCHNSGARSYPYAISAMWMRSGGAEGDGLVAGMYGPSRVSTRIGEVPVSVEELTSYPFGFDLEFRVNPAREVSFPIRLRVPAWSAQPAISARGAKITQDSRGFLVVQKSWRHGDRVRLSFKPGVQGRTAVTGKKALTYGPLVFCLPIPEKAEIVQRFPEAEAAGLKGFYGYQYDPVDLASAKRPLRLTPSGKGISFRVVRDNTADPLCPWDRSPLQLRGELSGADGKPEKVVLLPMGCTILRRTCF